MTPRSILSRMAVLFAFCTALIACLASAAQAADNAVTKSYFVQEAPRRGTAIVFVHGGGGSARTSWRDQSSSKSWPEWMVGDEVFRDASTFVYDYASPYLDRALNIQQLAVEMHAVLRDRGVLEHDRLVFVGHSLGGLVIKAFLLTYRDYAPKIRFLYFFGVPSKGTELMRFARYISNNPQPAEVGTLEGTLQLQLTQWRVMHSPMPRYPIYCAYEELPTSGLGMRIVDLSSAVEGCYQAPEPILADHVNMVKPRDRDTTTYVLLRDKYRRADVPVAAPNQDATLRARAALFVPIGIEAASRGNARGAVEMFSEAIRIDASYERAYFWRAQSYAAIGDRARAAGDFERALALNLVDPQDRALAERSLRRLRSEKPSPASPAVAGVRTRGFGPSAATVEPSDESSRAVTPDTQTLALGQVGGLFATEDAIRARAVARLIIEWSNEPWVVPLVVDAARAQLGNVDGLFSALSVLQSSAVPSLRMHESEVRALLAEAAARDPRLADQAMRLRARID